MRVLEALAAPANGAPFDKAFQTLKREGEPGVSVGLAGANTLEDTRLTFTEESLAEALRVAINEYNSETVFEVLN